VRVTIACATCCREFPTFWADGRQPFPYRLGEGCPSSGAIGGSRNQRLLSRENLRRTGERFCFRAARGFQKVNRAGPREWTYTNIKLIDFLA